MLARLMAQDGPIILIFKTDNHSSCRGAIILVSHSLILIQYIHSKSRASCSVASHCSKCESVNVYWANKFTEHGKYHHFPWSPASLTSLLALLSAKYLLLLNTCYFSHTQGSPWEETGKPTPVFLPLKNPVNRVSRIVRVPRGLRVRLDGAHRHYGGHKGEWAKHDSVLKGRCTEITKPFKTVKWSTACINKARQVFRKTEAIALGGVVSTEESETGLGRWAEF